MFEFFSNIRRLNVRLPTSGITTGLNWYEDYANSQKDNIFVNPAWGLWA